MLLMECIVLACFALTAALHPDRSALLCSEMSPGMPLPVCSGARVALDVAQALAFLHGGLGLVHFDVKPAVGLGFFLHLLHFTVAGM
jgi:hypothetical protein